MSFDETIIHGGAPALCGIKPACLFSMDGTSYESGAEKLRSWTTDFSSRNVHLVPLRMDGGRFLLFVYDRILLERLCGVPRNAAYLAAKGYPTGRGFGAVLSELLRRLSSGGAFPHEVGLFLGYPLEDVVGFETCGAERFKFSGFWKVYGDRASAIRKMGEYRACTEACMRLLRSGLSVPLATRGYKKEDRA